MQDLEIAEPSLVGDPERVGYLALLPNGSGAAVWAILRTGVDPATRALFAEWVEVKIDRFFEHGPEPDGWGPRKLQDGWQLWARIVMLPDLD